MGLSKKYQVLVFSAIAAVTTGLALSRDLLQTNSEKLLERTVDKAVKKWEKRLFLTPEQTDLMRETLTKFAHRKSEILQLKILKEGRKERLQELQLEENEEMRKFLADAQYESYINIISEKVK